MAHPKEKEITSEVSLCDSGGRLNPAAVGWSRRPLHNCNVSGHWPRKKKWNYWCVTSDDCVFSITYADVDYIGLAASYFFDLEKFDMIERVHVMPIGFGCEHPRYVHDDVTYTNRKLSFSVEYFGDAIMMRLNCPSMKGKSVSADITIQRPDGHESLNVVVPWDRDHFQFTSKQNTLPCEGTITVDGRTYVLKPEKSFATLDYGRGVWPYRVHWNWGAFSSWQGGDLVGFNAGSKWTDNTGSTENGICLNGRLYKISERVDFRYDIKDFMKPWDIVSEDSDAVRLKLVPVYDKYSAANAGVLKTACHCMFGHYSGTLRAGGKVIEVKDAFGWAEEQIGRW